MRHYWCFHCLANNKWQLCRQSVKFPHSHYRTMYWNLHLLNSSKKVDCTVACEKQCYCRETTIWQPVRTSFHKACYQFDNQQKISTTIPYIIKVTFASQTTQMLKGSQRTNTEPNSVVNTPLCNCNAKWEAVQCMCLPYLSVFPRRLRSPVLKVAMLNSHCTCQNITTWMRKTFEMFRTRLHEAFGSQ